MFDEELEELEPLPDHASFLLNATKRKTSEEGPLIRICKRIYHANRVNSLPNSRHSLNSHHLLELIQLSHAHHYMLLSFHSLEQQLFNEYKGLQSVFSGRVWGLPYLPFCIPTYEHIFKACSAFYAFLMMDERNILVLTDDHPSKVPSVLFLSCFLRYLGLITSTMEALDYLGNFIVIPNNAQWDRGFRKHLIHLNDLIVLEGRGKNRIFALRQILVNTECDLVEVELYLNNQLEYTSTLGNTQRTRMENHLFFSIEPPGITLSGFLVLKFFLQRNGLYTCGAVITIDPFNQSPGVLQVNKGDFDFSLNFIDSIELALQPTEEMAPLVYEPYFTFIWKALLSNFNSNFHVDPHTLEALESQGFENEVAAFVLILFQNDIHLAHEYLAKSKRHLRKKKLAFLNALESMSVTESVHSFSSHPSLQIPQSPMIPQSPPPPSSVNIPPSPLPPPPMTFNIPQSPPPPPINIPNSPPPPPVNIPLSPPPPSFIPKSPLPSPPVNILMPAPPPPGSVPITRPSPASIPMSPPPPPIIGGIPPPPPPGVMSPIMGAPSPPPLPPSVLSRNSSNTSLNEKIQVKNALHWDEIRDPQALSNSVWQEISEEKLALDLKKFERLFCTTGSEKSNLASTSTTSLTSSAGLKFLDLRRANNISIGLAKLLREGSISDLITRMQKHQLAKLSLDTLQSLQAILPTSEELSKARLVVKSQEADLVTMEAELFVLQTSRVSSIEDLCKALIFELNFEGEGTSLLKVFHQVTLQLKRLRESEGIKKLLVLVLDLGRLANYEYARTSYQRMKERPVAFRIESLLRLKDSHGVDRNTNMLDFLVECAHASAPSVLQLKDQFEDISTTRHYDLLSFEANYRALFTQFNETSSFTGDDPQFTQEFSSFLKEAKATLQKLKESFDAYKTEWETTASYFGESPINMKCEELLNLLYTFFQQLDTSRSKFKEKPLRRASSMRDPQKKVGEESDEESVKSS